MSSIYLQPDPVPVRRILEQVLLNDVKPSEYFCGLLEEKQLHLWFPEIEALVGVEQDPIFHPEGDVWQHTMLTLNTAAQLKNRAKKPLWFMLSVLCHDLGKPAAWQRIDGRIRALGHEKQGIEPAERFLLRLGYDTPVCAYVANMVQLHMRPNLLAAQGSGDKAAFRLFRCALCPEDLLLLARADRTSLPGGVDYEPTRKYLQEKLALFYEKE